MKKKKLILYEKLFVYNSHGTYKNYFIFLLTYNMLDMSRSLLRDIGDIVI